MWSIESGVSCFWAIRGEAVNLLAVGCDKRAEQGLRCADAEI
jgi:hypothetical protein